MSISTPPMTPPSAYDADTSPAKLGRNGAQCESDPVISRAPDWKVT